MNKFKLFHIIIHFCNSIFFSLYKFKMLVVVLTCLFWVIYLPSFPSRYRDIFYSINIWNFQVLYAQIDKWVPFGCCQEDAENILLPSMSQSCFCFSSGFSPPNWDQWLTSQGPSLAPCFQLSIDLHFGVHPHNIVSCFLFLIIWWFVCFLLHYPL